MTILYNNDKLSIDLQKVYIRLIRSAIALVKFSLIKKMYKLNGNKQPEYATNLLRNPMWISNKSLIKKIN